MREQITGKECQFQCAMHEGASHRKGVTVCKCQFQSAKLPKLQCASDSALQVSLGSESVDMINRNL